MKAVGYRKSLPIEDADSLIDFETAKPEPKGRDVRVAVKAISANYPCFVKAGNDLKSFMATKPFQTGFLGTPAQVGAGSSAGMVANGKAAMELQGDWDPAVMTPLTTDKNYLSKLGWFPFPAVSGSPAAKGVMETRAEATAALPRLISITSPSSVLNGFSSNQIPVCLSACVEICQRLVIPIMAKPFE